LSEKPTAAFALSLVGAIFIILGGLFSAVIGTMVGGAVGMMGFEWFGGLIIVLGILGLVFGILTLVGAIMINTGEKDKVRTGSIIVLVFSILSLFVGGTGGFIIGFILCLIGSILGLTWKPSAAEAPPPPPP